METDEEVCSLPIDSVTDRLSIGVAFEVTRICNPPPSEGCVWLEDIVSGSITLKG